MVRHALVVLFLAAPALAGHKSPISQALSDAKEAADLLDDEGGSCDRKAGGKLDDAIDALKAARDEGDRDAVRDARKALERVSDAVEEHCDGKTARRVGKLIEHALSKLPSSEHRRRDDDDDDAPPPQRQQQNGLNVGVGGFQFTVGGGTTVSSTTTTTTSAPESDGRYPMTGSAYASFLSALQANHNEILKKDTAISTLQRNWVSARQLGGVLDQFNNEILKMDVAKAARVTDPGNAVGLSSKFHNSIYQSEFVAMMNQQQ